MELTAKERRAWACAATRRLIEARHLIEHASEDLKWAKDTKRSAEAGELAVAVWRLDSELCRLLSSKAS
jgi:hypothetical protein